MFSSPNSELNEKFSEKQKRMIYLKTGRCYTFNGNDSACLR